MTNAKNRPARRTYAELVYARTQAEEIDRLRAVNRELVLVAQRVADWLDRLSTNSANSARDVRFPSLSEAMKADARNFRAVAQDLQAAIRKAKEQT